MKAAQSRFPYARVLAFLRTRLLGAVVMPAAIGAAWSARSGPVPLPALGLVLIGLAAAELLNLFGADYAHWRGRTRGEAQGAGAVILPGSPVILPGSPMVGPSRLEPKRIPAVLLPVALVGLAVVAYFTLTVGIEVLIFLGAAVVVGGLYVFSPFPYAFVATAVIPPLVSGGTHLALTGRTEASAFWAGLPVAWISLAVILGYRILGAHPGGEAGPAGGRALPRRRRALVLGCYALAGVTVVLWVPLGLLPAAGLLALLPWAACLAWLAAILRRRPADLDPVPATAVGVLMHTLSSGALALALWLG